MSRFALTLFLTIAIGLTHTTAQTPQEAGPPNPQAEPKAKLPTVFEQAALKTLADKTFRPAPFSVAGITEDSTAFKIESVRYASENITTSGLLATPKTGKAPYPAVVICHGYYPPDKYFQGLGTLDTIEALAREGFVVFVPDFRGFPPSEGRHDYPYPGEIVDVVQGVVSLSMHPKVNARKIAIIGYSMGGGYALQAAEILGDKIKAFVNYYGQLGGFFLRDDELGILLEQGLDLPTAEAIFKSRSPLYHLQRLKAPTIIFHGQNDRTVSITQSLMLHNELKRLGKSVELVTFPEYGHAFGDSFRNKSYPKLVEFLKTRLVK